MQVGERRGGGGDLAGRGAGGFGGWLVCVFKGTPVNSGHAAIKW